MSEFSFEVKEVVAVLTAPNDKGWSVKLTKTSWAGREPVYDIRSWNSDMSKCGKGKTFTIEELRSLMFALPTLPELRD